MGIANALNAPTTDYAKTILAALTAADARSALQLDYSLINTMVLANEGFSFYEDCDVATTANLEAVYDNGIAGIGRTLTNDGVFNAFFADGVFPPLNARVNVKNQTDAKQNGIYTVTTVGDNVSVNWVLTGATDFDESSEIIQNKSIFISGGDTQATKVYRVSSASNPAIGTDDIDFEVLSLFDIFSSGPVINQANVIYVATNGSDITGDGSFTNPYASVEYARLQIIARSLRPCTIKVAAGTYVVDGNMYLSGAIPVVGDGVASTFLTPNPDDGALWLLDPAWAGGTTGISNLTVTFPVRLSGFINDSYVNILNNNLAGNDVQLTGATPYNVFFNVFNNDCTQLVVRAGNLRTKSNSYFLQANVGSDANGQCSWISIGDDFRADLNFGSAAGNNASAYIYGGTQPGAIHLFGNNTTLNIDSDVYKTPVIEDSPTINLTTLGDGVKANFTPTNYTPVDASVTGNLKGIDTALGALSPDGFNVINQQNFTTSGDITYTPSAGIKYAFVRMIGAGAGSGGVAGGAGAGNNAASGAGGQGAYAEFWLTAAEIGVSLAGHVGVEGAGGAAGNNPGSNGAATTLATTAPWSCGGGHGGDGDSASIIAQIATGGLGGTVSTGTGMIVLAVDGQDGTSGSSNTIVVGGRGGGGPLGNGGVETIKVSAGNVQGQAGDGYGSGGGGSTSVSTNSNVAGQGGQVGAILITEFCRQ